MKLGFNLKYLLKDTLIARFQPFDKVTSHFIHLPQNVTQPIQAWPAHVLAIGTKFRYKDEIKVGDTVYLPIQFGSIIDDNDDRKRIFDGEDVLAVVTK